ncbi:MAG: hypothetical protein NTY63_02220 [Candidatus Bipolaricaulota bacterium]|nr:hypothetical protein [Candidatus Bipolaricaulota bacterium]
MRSLRRVAAELREAFGDGGIGPLYRVHLAALKTSVSYRFSYGLANLFLPISPLLEIAQDADELVGRLGTCDACKTLLARPPIPWQAVWSDETRKLIRTSPIITYGRHGSLITPPLLAAAVDRPDVKMVTASYIAKLGPNIARTMFPVYVTTPLTARTSGRKGLLPRAVGWLAYKLDPPPARDVARTANQATLRRAADHVRGGGLLAIAPDSRDPRQPWRPGVGALVAMLAQEPGAGPCYLVPWRIWGASITGIFHLLSRNPFLRALGRFRFRHPVRVEFGEPRALQAVVAEVGLDPAKITAYLEAHYKGLGY